MASLTKNKIDGLKPKDAYYRVWDSSLTGFGVKVMPTGSKIYIVKYRIGGMLRWYTIGKHGSPWTPESAKKEAKRVLGLAVGGTDPQTSKQQERKASTVAELCDDYLKHGCATKKASTIATDKGRIERHIKPLIGNKKVKDLNSNDIRRFMRDIANGKTAKEVKTGKHGLARVTGGEGTATRTVGLLGGILSYAMAEGIRSDNPVKGVKRYVDKKCERYLSPVELSKLGDALVQAEKNGETPTALNAIRLLLLTGCRKTEIMSLTWSEIDFDFGCLRLKDSKTGQKIVPLGKPALMLLDTMTPTKGNEYVFPSVKAEGYFKGTPKVWLRVRKLAGLEDVRLHDLRHSFASVGAGAGLGLQVVGKLLGHADPKTTARYAHIADDPARAAADRISGAIAGSLKGEYMDSNIVQLLKK